MIRSAPTTTFAYAVAMASLAVAVFLRWLLDPILGDTLPLTTLFAAIGVSVWIGGFRPALLVVALGYLACHYLFIQPRGEIDLIEPRDLVGFLLFLATAAIIIFFGEALYRARQHYRIGEEEERQRAELMRTTLSSIGDGVITTDLDGRLISMNPVAEQLTGWTNAEAAGLPVTQVFRIVNESTRLEVGSPALRALQDGVIAGLPSNTILLARDGTERPIDDRAAPIRSAQGAVTGSVLVFRDISERHRADAGQRAVQAQIAKTLESVTDGFIRYDRDWRIVYVNAEAERINRLPRAEMLGRILWEVFPALSGTDFEANFRRAVADGVTVEFENFYEPFGRWYSLKGYPTDDGGLTTFIRDITEQKLQYEALRRSEARLRRVFESNVVGMIRWDLDRSLILEANDTFLQMTGYTREDVAAGRLNFRDMTPPEWTPRNEEGIRNIQAAGFAAPYEKEYFRKDGSRIPLIIAGTRFEDSPSEGMSVLIDMSESKRAEQEIVRLAAESERQRRLYETVLTNTPDFVYVFSLDHKVLYANEALIRMWGRGHEGAIGRTFLEIGYEPWHAEMHDREIDEVRATRQPIRGEVPFHGSGGRREYDYIFVPIFGADGEVEAVAGTTRDVTERKEAEERLRAGEERLRTALAAARMVTWEWTPADGKLRVSENAADVFGLPAGVGLTGIDQGLALLHPDDAPIYKASFGKAIHERGSYRIRYRLLRPVDGRTIWIEERGHAAIDKPTDGVRLHGVAMDVTDRVQAEEEREALLLQIEGERARLADVFRQAPAFLCVLLGPEHTFEMANDRYFSLIGQRDILGKTVLEAMPEVKEQGFIDLLDGVYQSGEPFVGTGMRLLIDQTGEKFVDFVYQPLRDPDGTITGVVVVGVDVTARREIDEALRLSEERFRNLFNTMDEGFCVVEMEFDPTGRAIDYRIEEMNPAFEKHTGMQGLVGKSIRQEIPSLEDFWFDTYGRVAATGEPVQFIHQAGPMGGRWFDVSAFRLGGDGSNKVAILFNDITARKLSDVEREQLVGQLRDQDRRKDEFLATLAHELRNPLAPIRNGLQIIRMAGADGTIEETRSMMERQLGQMVRLVDDLLDVSRVTTGKLRLRTERVALRTVIDAAVETTRPVIEEAGHDLTLEVPDEPIFVAGDPTRLAQVVSNLLNNSAKYTHRGGHIRLTVHREEGMAVVGVADNGIGIPSRMVGKVFEMFTQVDRALEKTTGGLGIGLSLVKGLVEMHGGAIEARSEGEGRGSEFIVRLPVVPSAPPDLPPAVASIPDEPVAPLRRRRILVADDNVDSAESLGRLLGLRGNEVRTAHDGGQALETAAAFRPDVIFLDIAMPNLNGYEVCCRIREQPWGRHAVLVAMTGWGQDEDKLRSQEAGFDHHLVKPVDFGTIKKILLSLKQESG